MQATAAKDGSIMIFNSDKFQAGKHSRPVASVHSEFGTKAVTCLLWLPGMPLTSSLSLIRRNILLNPLGLGYVTRMLLKYLTLSFFFRFLLLPYALSF